MKDELSGAVRERLDAVIHGAAEASIPELVKAVLIDSMQIGSLAVPPGFRQPIDGTYRLNSNVRHSNTNSSTICCRF